MQGASLLGRHPLVVRANWATDRKHCGWQRVLLLDSDPLPHLCPKIRQSGAPLHGWGLTGGEIPVLRAERLKGESARQGVLMACGFLYLTIGAGLRYSPAPVLPARIRRAAFHWVHRRTGVGFATFGLLPSETPADLAAVLDARASETAEGGVRPPRFGVVPLDVIPCDTGIRMAIAGALGGGPEPEEIAEIAQAARQRMRSLDRERVQRLVQGPDMITRGPLRGLPRTRRPRSPKAMNLPDRAGDVEDMEMPEVQDHIPRARRRQA